MAKSKKSKSRSSAKVRKPSRSLGVAGFDPSALLAEVARETSGVAMTGNVPSSSSDGLLVDYRFLKAIANSAWRLKRRMVDSSTDEAKDEFASLYRHVEAIYDALRDVNLEIRDHEGEKYNVGSALDVVASEKRADLRREEIIETVKPTLRLGGKPLQLGAVIVGVPNDDGEDSASQCAEDTSVSDASSESSNGTEI